MMIALSECRNATQYLGMVTAVPGSGYVALQMIDCRLKKRRSCQSEIPHGYHQSFVNRRPSQALPMHAQPSEIFNKKGIFWGSNQR